MSKQIINIGNSPNDGNGEPARSAFNKTNKNFDEVYSALGGGSGTIPSVLPIANGGTGASNKQGIASNLGIIGINQSWQNKTRDRALGTNYTNTSSQPIFVTVLINYISGTVTPSIRINGIVVSQDSVTSATSSPSVSGLIPSGATYSVEIYGSGSADLNYWSELS